MYGRLITIPIALWLIACAQGTSSDPGAGNDAGPTAGDASADTDAQTVDCASGLRGWQAVGAPLDAVSAADTPAESPTLAALGDNTLIVAWREDGDLHVRRYQDASWSPMGGVISENPDTSPVYTPRIGASGSDVVLAYPEAGGASGTGFYARRWTGSEWELMGGGDLSTNSSSVSGGAVFFETSGDVLVAWSQYMDGEIGRSRVRVNRFTGTAFVPLNPEMGAGIGAITPRMVTDGNDRPVVVFSESGVRTRIRTSANDDWENLGPGIVAPLPVGSAHTPLLAQDNDRVPVIAVMQFDDAVGASSGFVLRWTGADWQRLGQNELNAQPNNTHAYLKGLTVDGDNRPVVAWSEGDPNVLYIQRWNGVAFENLGDIPLSAYDGTSAVNTADLTVDACGRTVLAFSEANPSGELAIHVYRYFD